MRICTWQHPTLPHQIHFVSLALINIPKNEPTAALWTHLQTANPFHKKCAVELRTQPMDQELRRWCHQQMAQGENLMSVSVSHQGVNIHPDPASSRYQREIHVTEGSSCHINKNFGGRKWQKLLQPTSLGLNLNFYILPFPLLQLQQRKVISVVFGG